MTLVHGNKRAGFRQERSGTCHVLGGLLVHGGNTGGGHQQIHNATPLPAALFVLLPDGEGVSLQIAGQGGHADKVGHGELGGYSVVHNGRELFRHQSLAHGVRLTGFSIAHRLNTEAPESSAAQIRERWASYVASESLDPLGPRDCQEQNSSRAFHDHSHSASAISNTIATPIASFSIARSSRRIPHFSRSTSGDADQLRCPAQLYATGQRLSRARGGARKTVSVSAYSWGRPWKPAYRLELQAHGKSNDRKRHALTELSVRRYSVLSPSSVGLTTPLLTSRLLQTRPSAPPHVGSLVRLSRRPALLQRCGSRFFHQDGDQVRRRASWALIRRGEAGPSVMLAFRAADAIPTTALSKRQYQKKRLRNRAA